MRMLHCSWQQPSQVARMGSHGDAVWRAERHWAVLRTPATLEPMLSRRLLADNSVSHPDRKVPHQIWSIILPYSAAVWQARIDFGSGVFHALSRLRSRCDSSCVLQLLFLLVFMYFLHLPQIGQELQGSWLSLSYSVHHVHSARGAPATTLTSHRVNTLLRSLGGFRENTVSRRVGCLGLPAWFSFPGPPFLRGGLLLIRRLPSGCRPLHQVSSPLSKWAWHILSVFREGGIHKGSGMG